MGWVELGVLEHGTAVGREFVEKVGHMENREGGGYVGFSSVILHFYGLLSNLLNPEEALN